MSPYIKQAAYCAYYAYTQGMYFMSSNDHFVALKKAANEYQTNKDPATCLELATRVSSLAKRVFFSAVFLLVCISNFKKHLSWIPFASTVHFAASTYLALLIWDVFFIWQGSRSLEQKFGRQMPQLSGEEIQEMIELQKRKFFSNSLFFDVCFFRDSVSESVIKFLNNKDEEMNTINFLTVLHTGF